MTNQTLKLLDGSISPYPYYCDGYGNPNASGTGYILGVVLSAQVVPKTLSHAGSSLVDKTIAFDKAEIQNAYLGQINMTIVSSFCGLNGLVWGYDIVRPNDLFQPHPLLLNMDLPIPTFTASTLSYATTLLLGTVDDKHFPFIPGSHVPCAGKSITIDYKSHIYSAIALGVPRDRSTNAILLMEDVGEIVIVPHGTTISTIKATILKNLISSILMIGENQKIEFSEVFLDIVDCIVGEDEVGCAMVAAPYLLIPKQAIPQNKVADLLKLDLASWREKVQNSYISKG